MAHTVRARALLAAFLVLVVTPRSPRRLPGRLVGPRPYQQGEDGDRIRHLLGPAARLRHRAAAGGPVRRGEPVLVLPDAAGWVVLADDDNTTVDRATVRFLQQRGVKVVPTVTNLRNGDWDPAVVRTVLHDPARLRTHVDDIVRLATTEGYDGIDLDYENLRAADRDAYSAFLQELSGALHARGKLLTSSVHPNTSDAGDDERNVAQDYRAIGAAVRRPGACDDLRLPLGDLPARPDRAGALGRGRDRLDGHPDPEGEGRPRRGLLGYDWVNGVGTTVDYAQAMALARRYRATVGHQDDGSPSFRYVDGRGRKHEVWKTPAACRPRSTWCAGTTSGGVLLAARR